MAKDVNQSIQETEKKLLPLLEEQFKDDLESVILYGSAVTGGWRPGVSDLNLLILLDHGSASGLSRLGKKAARLMHRLRLNCKFLTLREFLNSGDVFPMEYLEIRDAHRVLYGKDPTESLEISRENLRHQVEERVRGGLNEFRQALVDTKGKKRALTKLLKGWYGIQGAMIRSIVRLVPETVQATERSKDGDTVAIPAELLGIDTSIVNRLKSFCDSGEEDPVRLADEILDFWRELVYEVDQLGLGEE